MQEYIQPLSWHLSVPDMQCVHSATGEKEAMKPKSDSPPPKPC